jgi:PST family polysaccharide transporter
MIQWLNRVVRIKMIQNIMALYGVRIVNQFLPLIIIPYLARVLGPTGYGLVAFAQAFATYGIVAIEYGFELTGAREVAKTREDPQALGQLVAGVLGAQLVIGLCVAAAALAVQTMIPAFQEQPRLMIAGLAFALVQGLYPIWYFVGIERVPLIAAIDTVIKVIATFIIFAVVKEPDDGWLVLVCYAGSALASTLVGFLMMFREARPAGGSLAVVRRTLRLGFSVFLMRIGVLMHTTGNAFLMGLLVAPHHVAFFAAGEKLCRPAAWMMQPINQALLPRISHLLGQSPDQAKALAGFTLLIMIGLGLGCGLAIGILAPWLIGLFFGAAFLEEAVPVMRVMAMIIPLTVLNAALVSQWLIPHGLDRLLPAVVFTGAAVNVLLALVVVPRYYAIGMAWVTVGVEAMIVIGLLWVLHRHGLKPLDFGMLRRGLSRLIPSRR